MKEQKEQYGTIMNPKNCKICEIILDSITCAVNGNLEKRICDECKRKEDVS